MVWREQGSPRYIILADFRRIGEDCGGLSGREVLVEDSQELMVILGTQISSKAHYSTLVVKKILRLESQFLKDCMDNVDKRVHKLWILTHPRLAIAGLREGDYWIRNTLPTKLNKAEDAQ